MRKLYMFMLILFVILAVSFINQITHNYLYPEMGVIPGMHEDIPLYDGLRKNEDEFSIEGNHVEEIYSFYITTLPQHGWILQKSNKNSDKFIMIWSKKSFNGYLQLYCNYNSNWTRISFEQIEH